VVLALFVFSQSAHDILARPPALIDLVQIGVLLVVAVAMGLAYAGLASDEYRMPSS
jgi:hypothetical protein